MRSMPADKFCFTFAMVVAIATSQDAKCSQLDREQIYESVKCTGIQGRELAIVDSDELNQNPEICWIRNSEKSCIKIEEAGFIDSLKPILECSDVKAKALIAISSNYPVFAEYTFVQNGNAIKAGGPKTVTMKSTDEHESTDYKSALKNLRVGKFKEGFAKLRSAQEDPDCMGVGCRPSPEVLRDTNLNLVKTLGADIGTIAKAFAKNGKFDLIDILYESYFNFCYDLGLWPKAKSGALIQSLASDATKEVILPLNDWGYYLWRKKDYVKAQSILEMVVRLSPERAVGSLNLGDVLWDLGKKNEAKKVYQSYGRLVPKEKWPSYLKSRLD